MEAELSRVGNSCKLMKIRVWREKKALPLLRTGKKMMLLLSPRKRGQQHMTTSPMDTTSSGCHEQHTRRGDRGDKDLDEAGDINVLRIQRMESCGTTF